jgi:hypothetical protein
MTVFELPPKDYLRILVNLESRNGTKADFLSARILKHLPRVSKLLFIFTPSITRLD